MTGLEDWAKVTVAALLVVAFAALIVATVLAIRAASGTPGSEILLTGEGLREWTRQEVRAVGQRIRRAADLTVLALIVLVAALGFTWFGPDAKEAKPMVEVVGPAGIFCGELIGSTDGEMLVKGKELQRVVLSRLLSIRPAAHCELSPS